MKIKIYIGLFVMLFGTSCSQQPKVPSTTIEDFVNKMNNDSTLIILDVRTPQELIGPLGKIKTVINIPIQELADRIEELEKYKNNNIAVICRTGNRSTYCTKILLDNGFNAVNVLDGMVGYRKIDGVE